MLEFAKRKNTCLIFKSWENKEKDRTKKNRKKKVEINIINRLCLRQGGRE